MVANKLCTVYTNIRIYIIIFVRSCKYTYNGELVNQVFYSNEYFNFYICMYLPLKLIYYNYVATYTYVLNEILTKFNHKIKSSDQVVIAKVYGYGWGPV